MLFFFSSLCYVNFGADATIFLKSFFDHENRKKLTSKVAYTYDSLVFFLCSSDCQRQPRIDIPFYRFLYPMICGTIISGLITLRNSKIYLARDYT